MKVPKIAQKGAFVQFCKNTPSHCQSAFEEVQRHFVGLHGLVEVVQWHFVALHGPVEVVQRHFVAPQMPVEVIQWHSVGLQMPVEVVQRHFLSLSLDTCQSANTSSPAESCILLFLKYILIALATIFIELRYVVYNKSMFMCLNYNFYW